MFGARPHVAAEVVAAPPTPAAWPLVTTRDRDTDSDALDGTARTREDRAYAARGIDSGLACGFEEGGFNKYMVASGVCVATVLFATLC